ncbi:MAG TPA: hypothetical protein VFU21_24550 [Kofleriaceae bacterium]|nr:hypothetical protein [Kofleriaceae bacterium]
MRRRVVPLLLVALAGGPAAAEEPAPLVRRPPWLAPGVCEASLAGEGNLSAPGGGTELLEPVSLAPDLHCGAAAGLTVGVTHSARALSLVDSGGGLCLTGEDGGCPRPYDGGALDLRRAVPGGRAVRVALRARLVARSLAPFKPSARLGALVKIGGAGGRLSLLADPHVSLGLANQDQGNRDAVSLPLVGQLQLGRRLALELITGVRGELAGFEEKLAVPIAFGAVVSPGAAFDVGLEAGWAKLLGPQNTFKQRHAALFVTYRFAIAPPPPPAASYTGR